MCMVQPPPALSTATSSMYRMCRVCGPCDVSTSYDQPAAGVSTRQPRARRARGDGEVDRQQPGRVPGGEQHRLLRPGGLADPRPPSPPARRASAPGRSCRRRTGARGPGRCRTASPSARRCPRRSTRARSPGRTGSSGLPAAIRRKFSRLFWRGVATSPAISVRTRCSRSSSREGTLISSSGPSPLMPSGPGRARGRPPASSPVPPGPPGSPGRTHSPTSVPPCPLRRS